MNGLEDTLKLKILFFCREALRLRVFMCCPLVCFVSFSFQKLFPPRLVSSYCRPRDNLLGLGAQPLLPSEKIPPKRKGEKGDEKSSKAPGETRGEEESKSSQNVPPPKRALPLQ